MIDIAATVADTARIAQLDLSAQQSMAVAAEMMVGMAGLQLVISVLGTVALLVTVHLTQESLKETRRTVKAQAEATKHHLRPFIGMAEAEFVDHDELDPRKLRATYVNKGQTAAFSVALRAAFSSGEGPRFNDDDWVLYGVVPSIHPGTDAKVVAQIPDAIDAALYEDFEDENSRTRLFFALDARYDDAFGDHHHYRVVLRITGEGLRTFNIYPQLGLDT